METIRFSTFNASLNRSVDGELIEDLSTPDDPQVQAVAEIIQRINPDILNINEFDYGPNDEARSLFQDNYLSVSQNGVDPVEYPYVYQAPSNTGIASGFDLDNNGEIVTEPGAPGYGGDAFGFGNFPGQFGMLVLSKYPIIEDEVRTFQTFLWEDMPGALLPVDPESGESWYSEEELDVFRLASKSFWDIPINVNGEVIHLLSGHPTPPVFDGPEDRNGTRNHDEIRFWADYVTPGEGDYIYDDESNFGGLEPGSKFVFVGDQNADPLDGDSVDQAILQVLDNPQFNTSVTPSSEGGTEASERQGGVNETHEGDPAFDTGDFDNTGSGNLRTDYVLPSANLDIEDSAVFWPTESDPLFRLTGDGGEVSSDHRPVWVDVNIPDEMGSESVGVKELTFLGEVTFPAGTEIFEGTTVGGLSSLSYDRDRGVYYVISDDQVDPRFYTVSIDISDGNLDQGDVTFEEVTTILNEDGNPYPDNTIDLEGLVYNETDDTLFFSTESIVNRISEGFFSDPFIKEISLNGEELAEVTVSEKFLPVFDDDNVQLIGDRNRGFENLNITPSQEILYAATEDTLVQDGDLATVDNGGKARIIRYDLDTRLAEAEFLYPVEPVAEPSNPEDAFNINGLAEILPLDDNTLLGLERSFSVGGEGGQGTGNIIKLFEVDLQNAENIIDFDSILDQDVTPVTKELLLNFDDLGIPIDNVEGLTYGPILPDGTQSLILVSDDNFAEGQFTQFMMFGLETVPAIDGTNDADTLVGEDGDEKIRGFAGDDLLAGNLGDDQLNGNDGNDVLRGDENSRSTGGVVGGNDTLKGGDGDDHLGGKGGDDELFGEAGNDHIWGDDGDDLLRGGLGDDVLTGDDFSGGEGADTFVLAAGEGTDTITDFEVGIDQIKLIDLMVDDVSVSVSGSNTVIEFNDEILAIIEGVNGLNTDAFVEM
ncbi:MAG: esterase-like activity of phytase family protein [Cyanobacteria bacterium J06592_8]